MSAYATGLQIAPTRHTRHWHRAGAATVVGFRLGNFPGYLLDEMKRLDGEIEAFNQDLQNGLASNQCPFERDGLQAPLDHSGDSVTCKRLYGFWSGPWMEFRGQWKDFMENHDSGGLTGWYQRFWGGSIGETLDAFRSALVGYRSVAPAAGFTITSPAPVAPARGLVDKAGDAVEGLAALFKWLVVGAVVVGAIFLLGLLFKGGSVGKMLVVKG